MFTLKLDTDNAAFCADDPADDSALRAELARIMRAIAESMESGFGNQSYIIDANGNRVGQWRLES